MCKYSRCDSGQLSVARDTCRMSVCTQRVPPSFFVTSYSDSVCLTPKCVAFCWHIGGGSDTDTRKDVRRGTGPPYAYEIEHPFPSLLNCGLVGCAEAPEIVPRESGDLC